MSLLTQLGIRYPIFLAPMAGITTPVLASRVSEAGGLGALGLGAGDPFQAEAAIRATQQLTSQPFQVNFFCHRSTPLDPAKSRAWCEYLSAHFAQFEQAVPAQLLSPYASFTDSPELLDVILATRPAVVSFHFGLPPKSILQVLQRAKIPYWVSVTRLSEALYAQQQGCSAIIAQGIEAGGHRATFDPLCDAGLSTRELLQQLAPQISLPIISAGGVMTGGQINQLLTQGASAAQLGTAFMACRESAASDQLRQRLSTAKSTQITDVISGRPARGVIGRWQQEIDSPIRPPHAGYPYSYALAKQLDKIACAQGVTDYQVCWAGTGVTALRPLDASPLMQTLIAELQ
ncbi:NAD(P)H-dependent flavin oxidoreductase [Rosenbergiella nectarea]|uniref:NAD(P)H-dependent flavin oxidoreductase n=1 Tax=Rosenbergiella nectarea TaxID=988801 RepID=UPI001F4D9888|nr:nitronate monooxygenase [Rosenbergiella nectarea]MBT0729473.1 nitronate monooxygenase [Rosenbergiella nectarea subsp. apis]